MLNRLQIRSLFLTLSTIALLTVPSRAGAQLSDTLTIQPYRGVGELGTSLRQEFPITEPIRLEVRLQQRRVYLLQGDRVKKIYPIAIGKPGWETPTGTFKVTEMQRNPAWVHPFTGEVVPPTDPEIPITEAAIVFTTSTKGGIIGFHGTPNRDSIGTAASHGCVRMYNEHIREMYKLVALGTLVVVKP
ncbi:ErfK/YbiS/YcfS/YnhG family protein [Leptolyngbya sp. NIES-3755]|nr:ErfK/YbiS/YcfS/YnhG family protein [Leptolyngbya sp. NIES-3755]